MKYFVFSIIVKGIYIEENASFEEVKALETTVFQLPEKPEKGVFFASSDSGVAIAESKEEAIDLIINKKY